MMMLPDPPCPAPQRLPPAPDAAAAVLVGPAERERVLRLLRRQEGALRARGEADLVSDVDLIRLEDELGRLVGGPVEIATAPEQVRPRIRNRVEHDAVEIF